MSLRPRYSLLTLLVLTALVAGVTGLVVIGSKRWRGPHHVVEQTNANEEKEYTYTRDWQRNRVIQGPMVIRRLREQKLVFFAVIYFRQGKHVDWVYRSEASEFARRHRPKVACPLTADEHREFHDVRDTEILRLHAAGGSSKHEREGIEDYVITGGGARMRAEQTKAQTSD